MIPDEVVLQALDLRVARGEKSVLRGLSCAVRRGEIVGLLGPSGAGKTTLFDALAGEVRLRGGEVRLSGVSLGDKPLFARARLGLSYLPQGPSVLHDLSVRDNLVTFARLARRGLSEASLAGILERFALGGHADVVARQLSGGERRRLELARATLTAPLVLLADEPFSGMDPRSVEALAQHLRALADGGLAILVSDHRAADVLSISDRALLLIDGAVVAESDAASFAAHPDVTSRYLRGVDEERAPTRADTAPPTDRRPSGLSSCPALIAVLDSPPVRFFRNALCSGDFLGRNELCSDCSSAARSVVWKLWRSSSAKSSRSRW